MSDPGTFELSELSGTFNLTINGYPPGAATALADLTDVNVPSPADGGPLVYDDGTGKWVSSPKTGAVYTADGLVADADLSGGSFTTLDAVNGDGTTLTAAIPRASLVGAVVGVASGTDGGKLYTVTSSGPCTLVAACASGDVVALRATRSIAYAGNAAGPGGTGAPGAADRFVPPVIGYEGTGLDATMNNLAAALRNHEGTLDRWDFVVAIAESNVNLAALGSATWTYGTLDTAGGVAWMRGQTDPDEDGLYEVGPSPTYTATKLEHPDALFYPPGQGHRVTLKSGDADDGRTWVWLDDDPSTRMRVNGLRDESATGRWVEVTGFGGGGGGGDVATDAIFDAKGDLPVGTGSNTAAKLTVGANDTILMAASGEATGLKWANASTTRTALGLGGAATLNVGTTAGTVAAGDDARFAQTPVNVGAGTTRTSTGSDTLASIMPSTPTVYGSTGDMLHINAMIRIKNNTGSNATAFDVQVKLGSTTVWDLSGYTLASSASDRYAWLRVVIPVGSSNTTREAIGSLAFDNLTARTDRGTSTADLTSGQTFDITGRTGSGSANEEIQLMWATVVRNRA